MGAPIKINKDLLVITPNYTKKWLAEGQPKVSGLSSQVAFPFAPCALPVWVCQRARIYEQKIKKRDCPSAPHPQGSNIPELQTKEPPAQGCLIPHLSSQDLAKETHFPSVLDHRHMSDVLCHKFIKLDADNSDLLYCGCFTDVLTKLRCSFRKSAPSCGDLCAQQILFI